MASSMQSNADVPVPAVAVPSKTKEALRVLQEADEVEGDFIEEYDEPPSLASNTERSALGATPLEENMNNFMMRGPVKSSKLID